MNENNGKWICGGFLPHNRSSWCLDDHFRQASSLTKNKQNEFIDRFQRTSNEKECSLPSGLIFHRISIEIRKNLQHKVSPKRHNKCKTNETWNFSLQLAWLCDCILIRGLMLECRMSAAAAVGFANGCEIPFRSGYLCVVLCLYSFSTHSLRSLTNLSFSWICFFHF